MRLWLPLAFAAIAALLTAMTLTSAEEIERATLDRHHAAHRALADQGARELEVYLDAIHRRLRDPAVHAFAGIDRAMTPDDLTASLRIFAGDLPTAQVVFFVHDRTGRVVAVDPAIDVELAGAMLAHDHDDETGAWVDGAGVCPMCAASQHSISLTAPLRDGTFVAANVRLDRVGDDMLAALAREPRTSVCLRSGTNTPVACRGSSRGEHIGVRAQVGDYPLTVEAATEHEIVIGGIRQLTRGMFVAAATALVLLAVVAGILLWRERVHRRAEVTSTSRLAHVDKLASLGVMAAGVMHEIASPLTVIQANAEMLDQLTPAELAEVRGDLIDAVDRIQQISNDLRRYSRAPVSAMETFDIRDPIETAVRLTAPATRHKCRVEVRPSSLIRVHGNMQHVVQIVVNLISNSTHAVRGRTWDQARVIIGTRFTGRRLELYVEDNGAGVADQDIARLFTWFFTTKSADEGTGLGLALCARMADAGGGRLRYEPASPGARFVLELPLAGADPTPGA